MNNYVKILVLYGPLAIAILGVLAIAIVYVLHIPQQRLFSRLKSLNELYQQTHSVSNKTRIKNKILELLQHNKPNKLLLQRIRHRLQCFEHSYGDGDMIFTDWRLDEDSVGVKELEIAEFLDKQEENLITKEINKYD